MVSLNKFDEDPFLKKCGVQVSKEMVKLDAHILPTPGITYGRNKWVHTVNINNKL